MPTRRLRMRQLREILRLKHEVGLTHRAIADACDVASSTVSLYVERAAAAGLGRPVPADLDDAALEGRLFRRAFRSPGTMRPILDAAVLHQELTRRGVTLQLLWQEYRAAHPQGYSYSQFCEHDRRWVRRLKPSMRQVHRAGEKVFLDFAGQKAQLVNPTTGELTAVEIFVGVLGASGLLYAEATLGQDLGSWVGAHVRMLEAYQGCPAIWVPDNLRSPVTSPHRYEPTINRTYLDLAQHYGAVVIPARIRRPQDKALAELGVLLAERWVLAALRHRTFFSLADLNAAIRERVQAINARPMKRVGVSRQDLYERLDRPALRPLPATPFELAEWKLCRVNVDDHVECDHHVYRVPYTLLHEQVDVRLTATTVEVFFQSRRVASQARLTGRGRSSTQAEHMPRAHREYAAWTPERLVAWAGHTGPATALVVAAIMARRAHPEQGFRACLGLMRLGRIYGADRLEAACVRADRLQAYRYQTLENILRNGQDRLPLPGAADATRVLPFHANVRGAAYYGRKERP